MGVFGNMLGADETLFKNAIALDYDYVPKIIPFREREQKQIAACIKPLFMKRNGRNVFVHGPPGVGKSVAIKKILDEIDETTDEIIPLYINCWKKNTSYKVFSEICRLLDYKFIHNKNTDELFDVVKRMLNPKASVLVFDEIDRAEETDFLYYILEEIFLKSIVLVTNYRETVVSFDSRIKSRLLPEIIEFKPYSLSETKEILVQRSEYAYYPGVISEEAIGRISEASHKIGDIRIGLFLLRESGNNAEARSARKVEPGDVELAVSKLDKFSIKSFDVLDSEERKIYELIMANPETKIGELFRLYQNKGGKGVYKTFQRKIESLRRTGLSQLTKLMAGLRAGQPLLSLMNLTKGLLNSKEKNFTCIIQT